MSVATVTLTGYVALEPKLWFTKQAHTPVVNLRVGMTPRRMDVSTGEWKDGTSSFFTVNCWRKLALNVSASMHKGDPVIIRGQLRMRSWNDDGKTRTTVEIEAESIGHNVAYGFSHFMKGIHPSLLRVQDGSAVAAALDELGPTGGGGPAGAAAGDEAWPSGSGQSGTTGLLTAQDDSAFSGEPLRDPAAEQDSTELASGSSPLDEGVSDDSAGIPDGDLATGGVPF